MTNKAAHFYARMAINQLQMFIESLDEDSLDEVVPSRDFAYAVTKMAYEDDVGVTS